MLRKMFASWLVRGIALAAILAVSFWHRVPTGVAIAIAVTGALLLNIAITMLMTGVHASRDGKILDQRGMMPRDGARVAVEGTLRVTGTPLRSPFTGLECALYSYQITHMEYHGGETSGGPNRPTKTVNDFAGVALTDVRIGDARILSFPAIENFPAAPEPDVMRAESFVAATKFEKRAFNPVFDEATNADWEIAGRRNFREAKLYEAFVPANVKAAAIGKWDAAANGLRDLRLIGGDARAYLASAKAKHPRTGAMIAAPVIAVLAILFLMPARVLPSSLLESQRYRVAEALRNDDIATLRKVVAGIDLNAPVDGASLPLMIAQSAAAAQVLLDAGADPNGHAAQSLSVLMSVARSGRADVAELLIEHGANVNEVNPVWNQTALAMAREAHEDEVAAVLVKAGAK